MPPRDAALLEVDGLVVDYRHSGRGHVLRAIDGLDLTLRAGDRVAIVGESGSGKTTVGLALMGLLPPGGAITGGSIRWAGEELVGTTERRWRALRGGSVGMVFQDASASLDPVRTVGSQIVEAVRAHRRGTVDQARQRAIELLREVDVPAPEDKIRQYPHELSGGQRQRAMIAMALACDPSLLIADEPTSALDVTTQAGVIDLLGRLADERGMATILITHDLGIVAAFADEVLVLYAGAPMEHGPIEAVFSHGQHPYSRALLASVPRLDEARSTRLRSIAGMLPSQADREIGCRFVDRCDIGRDRPECRTDRPAMREVGQAMAACHYAGSPAPSPDQSASGRMSRSNEEPTFLYATSMSKTFQVRTQAGRRTPLRAVHDVTITVGRGRSLGVVGESGSGKTTLARLLIGLERADSGEIRLGDAVVSRDPGRHGRIQMVFQDPSTSLDPTMRVDDLVAEPLRIRGGLGRQQARRRAVELLHAVGLSSDHAGHRPAQLSGGQNQRVAIARALATEPELIICDEAVSALDMSVRGNVLNLLDDLQARTGVTYLHISHDLSMVRHVCDDVAVMHTGKLVEMAPVEELFGNPCHPYTRALLAAVPVPDPVVQRGRAGLRLKGDVPDPTMLPSGCPFRTRCPLAFDRCADEEPALVAVSPTQVVACHLYPPPAEEIAAADTSSTPKTGQ